MMFLSLIAVPVFALDLPQNGEYVVAGGCGGDLKITSIDAESATVVIPICKDQYEKENLTNPKWQIFASIAYFDGEKWQLIPKEDYSMKTTISEKGDVIAKIKVPKIGTGLYWSRIWGQDKVSQKWLWIDQKSQYNRNNKENNPSYEFIFDTSKKSSAVVPANYAVRQ